MKKTYYITPVNNQSILDMLKQNNIQVEIEGNALKVKSDIGRKAKVEILKVCDANKGNFWDGKPRKNYSNAILGIF